MSNTVAKLGKYPHNLIIDVFGKDSANADEAICVYTEMIKRKNPEGWEKYIRILKYYYMEGLTIADTAREMGLSAGRVRQILCKNKRMLQSVSSTLFPNELIVETTSTSDFNRHFTVRAVNVLYRYGLRNAEDVLIGIRGVGKGVLGEIMRYIGQPYFNKWWPKLANKVDVTKISDNDMYKLCKSYQVV